MSNRKLDLGDLPRFIGFRIETNSKNKEIREFADIINKEMLKVLYDIYLRINALEGTTETVTFDKSVNSTITIQITRGSIKEITIT